MPSLNRLSWTTARAAPETVLIVPVGATEQHGPHLPLTTDSDIAEAVATRLLTDNVAVTPVIAFGSSGEHQGFAGTLSVGQSALEAFLIELGRSAACTWERVIFLSTHGGNRDVVRRATRQLQTEGRDVREWFPRWGGDHHAGRTESSLMLAIDPSRVDLAAAEPGVTEPLAQLLPRLRHDGVAAVSANGILGDPAGASAEEGERLLAGAAASLREFIARWPTEELRHDVA
jgi:mycofactocin system creatininase family protein